MMYSLVDSCTHDIASNLGLSVPRALWFVADYPHGEQPFAVPFNVRGWFFPMKNCWLTWEPVLSMLAIQVCELVLNVQFLILLYWFCIS